MKKLDDAIAFLQQCAVQMIDSQRGAITKHHHNEGKKAEQKDIETTWNLTKINDGINKYFEKNRGLLVFFYCVAFIIYALFCGNLGVIFLYAPLSFNLISYFAFVILLLLLLGITHFLACQTNRYWLALYLLVALFILITTICMFVPILYQPEIISFNLPYNLTAINSGNFMVSCSPTNQQIYFSKDSNITCRMANTALTSYKYELRLIFTHFDVPINYTSTFIMDETQAEGTNFTPHTKGPYLVTPQLLVYNETKGYTQEYVNYKEKITLLDNQELVAKLTVEKVGILLSVLFFILVVLGNVIKNLRDISEKDNSPPEDNEHKGYR